MGEDKQVGQLESAPYVTEGQGWEIPSSEWVVLDTCLTIHNF